MEVDGCMQVVGVKEEDVEDMKRWKSRREKPVQRSQMNPACVLSNSCPFLWLKRQYVRYKYLLLTTKTIKLKNPGPHLKPFF